MFHERPWTSSALTFSTAELTPSQRRSLWRGEELTFSPQAQRAAWRAGWKTPTLVRPAPHVTVLQSQPFWWAQTVDQRAQRLGRVGLYTLWLASIAHTLLPFVFGALGATGTALVLGGAVLVQVPRWRALRLRVRRWIHERRLERAPHVYHPAGVAPGTWMRVCGRVLDGPTMASATGTRCVVACYVGDISEPTLPMADWQVHTEVHAMSFRMILPSRELVHVRVENARFVPRPYVFKADRSHFRGEPLAALPFTKRGGAAASAQIRHEEIIAPGDAIEVFGCFHRTLDCAGSAGSRTPAVETVMSGESRRPLLLRALRD